MQLGREEKDPKGKTLYDPSRQGGMGYCVIEKIKGGEEKGHRNGVDFIQPAEKKRVSGRIRGGLVDTLTESKKGIGRAH